VSEDLRNSLYLWGGGIAFALIFWLGLKLDLLFWLPVEWVWSALAILGVLNLIKLSYNLWQRRQGARRSSIDG
jgi:hypothetical protein